MRNSYRDYVRNRPKFYRIARRGFRSKSKRLSRKVQSKTSNSRVNSGVGRYSTLPNLRKRKREESISWGENFLRKYPKISHYGVKALDWSWDNGLRDIISYPLKMARRGQLRGYKDL